MATRTSQRGTISRATKTVKNAAKKVASKVLRPVEKALVGNGRRKTSPSSKRRTTARAGRK
jgi:hypothetical protein